MFDNQKPFYQIGRRKVQVSETMVLQKPLAYGKGFVWWGQKSSDYFSPGYSFVPVLSPRYCRIHRCASSLEIQLCLKYYKRDAILLQRANKDRAISEAFITYFLESKKSLKHGEESIRKSNFRSYDILKENQAYMEFGKIFTADSPDSKIIKQIQLKKLAKT